MYRMILRNASDHLPSDTVLHSIRLKSSVLLFVCNLDSAQWSPNCIVFHDKKQTFFCDRNQLNKRKWKQNLYILLSAYFLKVLYWFWVKNAQLLLTISL